MTLWQPVTIHGTYLEFFRFHQLMLSPGFGPFRLCCRFLAYQDCWVIANYTRCCNIQIICLNGAIHKLHSFVVIPLLKFSTFNYIYIDVLETTFLMVPNVLQVTDTSRYIASSQENSTGHYTQLLLYLCSVYTK